jgi:hypothetical protein
MTRRISDTHWNRLWQIIRPAYARRGLEHDCVQEIGLTDLVAASYYLASTEPIWVNIVTGFFLPRFGRWETDGPMGAVLLAACLWAGGHHVQLITESGLAPVLQAALAAQKVPVRVMAWPDDTTRSFAEQPVGTPAGQRVPVGQQATTRPSIGESIECSPRPTCWIAVERPGPAYTPRHFGQRWPEQLPTFLARVPPHDWDRYHDMSGNDITAWHYPAHRFFEGAQSATIGIGDGGNEIGMGKLAWAFLAEHVRYGERIACRVPTDWLIPASVSNWGAYALAAAVCGLRGLRDHFLAWAEPHQQKQLWREVMELMPLCDGVTGRPANQDGDLWIDGLPWSEHAAVLDDLRAWVNNQ